MGTYKTHGTYISKLMSDDLIQAVQTPPPTSKSFLTTNPAYAICPNAHFHLPSPNPHCQSLHIHTSPNLYLKSAANPPFLFKS